MIERLREQGIKDEVGGWRRCSKCRVICFVDEADGEPCL